MYKGDNVIARVIEQAHKVLGHFGAQRAVDYIHRWYWWPRLGHEIDKYCQTCSTCHKTKEENKLPQGLLHSLPIPRQP